MQLDDVTISRAITETYMKEFLDYLVVDVAVVGAGPAGMTAAYYLAKAGHTVTVFYELEMASERELRALFQDCDLGAVPALSNAYGLDVVWDDQLKAVSDIYIEAGDHEHLVHIRGEDFRKLMRGMPHNIISAEKDYSRWMHD